MYFCIRSCTARHLFLHTFSLHKSYKNTGPSLIKLSVGLISVPYMNWSKAKYGFFKKNTIKLIYRMIHI